MLIASSAAAGGFAAAALGAHRVDWGFANEFGCHYARYEEFATVIVEVDRGAFGIRFGNDTETILLVFDLLSSGKNLHIASFEPFASSRTLFLPRGATPEFKDHTLCNAATFEGSLLFERRGGAHPDGPLMS